MQQGDVLQFQTDDNGDISVESGIVEMTGGLDTAVYLSLFGGNEDDDGRNENNKNWWGNLSELEESRQYRSRTQYLLRSIPATSSNLLRIEQAVKADLSWLSNEEITVTATIPGINRVRIQIEINADQTTEYILNWEAAQ